MASRYLLTPISGVALFLFIQAGLVSWAAHSERLPPVPSLQQFPSSLGRWTKSSEDNLDAATISQLQADLLLSWNFTESDTGAPANWFVAWFRTQRNGAQPHSPKVCLPAGGWIPDVSDEIAVPTSAGTITANRYIVNHAKDRAVILYWFETPRRAIASEWAAKFWTLADAIGDHRTDVALARVVVFESNQSDAVATATAVRFAGVAYPALRQLFRPRAGAGAIVAGR